MAQDVIGDVQHVIRLVVRQMAFEQVQLLINRRRQTRLLGQPVHGPQTAVGESPGALGHLIMNIGRAEHGPVLRFPLSRLQSSLDSLLASS